MLSPKQVKTGLAHTDSAERVRPVVAVRRLTDHDSIPKVTRLLHHAYAAQVAMGLRPLAGRQDDETTARRCASGECYLATLTEDTDQGPVEHFVGTILFHEIEDAKGPPWFANNWVDSFSQFGVDPHYQGHGIGQMLLGTVELRASQCGAKELALSMAEPDSNLMRFYMKRGYRFIELWQWPYTNYKSAILSKSLADSND
ncbi:MAG: GNAT family N-acetyltransferase [Phycisphaerales bacterium]|nr:MAG: GNAT family N-acetyltransferase [Phycisphaerales bacterium]